ncbi:MULTISPECIES: transposase [Amycolatopsis]|uniref:transposase n=1 Tax=Amycolatopsis TaxID=1813 RepID=UPI001E59C121|nr:transposase [Amycolatopsis bullii]
MHGIGAAGAARLLADVGDTYRFGNRDRFALRNGTAPLDASSGEQQRHRLSRAGNRRINRTLHIMGVVQLRNPAAGRAYFDGRKAAGKTSMEAMRSLKRRLSNVVYARMLADQKRREVAGPGGQSGTTLQSGVTGLTLDTGPSDKSQPEPANRQPALAKAPLDIKGSHERTLRICLPVVLVDKGCRVFACVQLAYRSVQN